MSLVTAFNTMGECVKFFSNMAGAEYVKNGVYYLIGSYDREGVLVSFEKFKTFVVKPLTLFADERVRQTMAHAPLLKSIKCEQLGNDATVIKTVLSGMEVFTNLPLLWKSITAPVSEAASSVEDFHRTYFKKNSTSLENNEHKVFTPNERVANRIYSIARWTIAFADFIKLIKRYAPIPTTLDQAVPYIYPVSGLYMGTQGLYKEVQFFLQCYWNEKTVPAHWKEAAVSISRMVLNIAYIAQSAVAGFAIFQKSAQEPQWLMTTRFVTNVTTALLPSVLQVAKDCNWSCR